MTVGAAHQGGCAPRGLRTKEAAHQGGCAQLPLPFPPPSFKTLRRERLGGGSRFRGNDRLETRWTPKFELIPVKQEFLNGASQFKITHATLISQAFVSSLRSIQNSEFKISVTNVGINLQELCIGASRQPALFVSSFIPRKL
jgi:hypothetical protein